MTDDFQPKRRPQIDPAELAALEEVGDRIAERLRELDASALYDIAADACEPERVRWEAAFRLPRELAQLLADTLIQRRDEWWVTMVLICPPTDSPATPATVEALKQQLSSPVRGCRLRAMQLLSKMRGMSLEAEVSSMLAGDDQRDRFVAVTCLAARNDEASVKSLADYVGCDANPVKTRIEAAVALLRLGHADSVSFLRRIAQEDGSENAYDAAVGVLHHHDKIEGYRLFQFILSKPDHAAAPMTVCHVCHNMGNYELGYEAAGLIEARRWLSSQIGNAG